MPNAWNICPSGSNGNFRLIRIAWIFGRLLPTKKQFFELIEIGGATKRVDTLRIHSHVPKLIQLKKRIWMNTLVLVVACLNSLALLAHLFGGTKDNASIAPVQAELRLVRNWRQSMCAFQMLTVDLAIVSALLFVIALTDLISFEYELILLLSVLYLLWGIVWLVQLVWLRSNSKAYLELPQWLFWFVCSGLLYLGA